MERGEGDDSRKRSTDGGKDGRPSKRHRFVLDEAALRISLTLGWKRETLIRTIGKSGVRGNVTYYSPGRRRPVDASAGIRHRYVERQGIGTNNRDNFSFSIRCIVGDFIQPLGESPNAKGFRLGEPEVRHLVEQICIARGWNPHSQCMMEEEKEAMTRQREAKRVAQCMEARKKRQEGAGSAARRRAAAQDPRTEQTARTRLSWSRRDGCSTRP